MLGKGGVGKSTVAAALALSTARAGGRALVVEVAGQQRLSQLFSAARVGDDEATELRPGLFGISIDAERATEEYLAGQLKIRPLVELLTHSKAFHTFAAAAPGLPELVTIGKIWSMAIALRPDGGAPVWDTVTVDCPATGHGIALLETAGNIEELAAGGPIRDQAARIQEVVSHPAATGIVIVAQPQELAVAEAIEATATLRGHGLPVAAAVLNGVHPARFCRIRRARRSRAVADAPGAVGEAARAALRHLEQQGDDAAYRARLADGTGLPVIDLPRVVRRRIDLPALELAGRRARRGPRLGGGRGVIADLSGPPPGDLLRHRRRGQDHDLGGARAATRRERRAHGGGHDRPGPAPRERPRHDRALRRAPPGAAPTPCWARARAELWALQLDAKATFDRLVSRYAADEAARTRILENRIYRHLSGAVGGAQEYMAVERLHELVEDGGFECIVLDTPPATNALDFLDAPQRITRFIEGRALRLLLRPGAVAGGLGWKILHAGSGTVLSLLERLTGAQLLRDVSDFLAGFDGMYQGFADRATGREDAAPVGAVGVPRDRRRRARLARPGRRPVAAADLRRLPAGRASCSTASTPSPASRPGEQETGRGRSPPRARPTRAPSPGTRSPRSPTSACSACATSTRAPSCTRRSATAR